MTPEALTFLRAEEVGVLALAMPDGSPHGATVHFAHFENPFTLILLTSPNSRKAQAFQDGEALATFVIGAQKDSVKTLQMDGVVKPFETEEMRQIYFDKFPKKREKHAKDLFFIFTPTWWRFTDWTASPEKRITTSLDIK